MKTAGTYLRIPGTGETVEGNLHKGVVHSVTNFWGLLIINCSLFMSLSTSYVSSQINYPKWHSDTLHIEEVSVLATKPLSDAGIVKNTIDSLVMEEKVTSSLAELLSEHSPIFIKNYGRGSLATASFRGTASSHTKVTWNGMEINSPMLGMVDFSLIPVYFADEISLFHGAGSMQEVQGALGGLISLNTKPDWSKNFSGRVLQGVGSYGSYDSFLKIQAGSKKLQSGTRIFYSSSENNFRFINRDVIDSVNLETGEKFHPEQNNKNAGYKQYGILQELFYRPDNRNLLKLSFWGQKAERGIPFLSGNETGTENIRNQQSDEVLRMTGSWKYYADNFNIQYLGGFNIQSLDYLFGKEISGLGNISLIHSDSRSLSFLNRLESEFKPSMDHEIKIRFDHKEDFVNSYELITGLGYEKQKGHTSLMATWGYRINERLKSGISLGEEIYGEEWSPLIYSIRAEYQILQNKALFLKSGIARNIKFPGMNDLYYQPGGNPDLKMESGFSREIGIEWSSQITTHVFNIGADCYYTEVKDWILWLPSFKGYWEPRNIDEVRVSGLELTSGLRGSIPGYEYRLRFDYAYTRSVNKSTPNGITDMSAGKQLPFIPVHSANATFHGSKNGWSLTWIWNYFSERFISSSNTYHSSRDYLYPFFMNQITAGRMLRNENFRGEIRLGIHNLLNEEYRSILQRPMPGRNYSIMLKVDF